MLETRELRIGNIIYLNGKKSVVGSDEIAFIGKCHLLGINCETTPIKITEETLKGIGFEFEFENMTNRVYAKEGIKLLFHPTEGIALYSNGNKIGKNFFYIHQLQNLWFCLLGKELTKLL